MTENNRNRDHYRRLTVIMVMFVMAVSLIPLAVIGVLTLNDFQIAYGTKVREHLRELVQKHTHTIDSFLNSRLGEIRVFSRSYSISEITDQSFLEKELSLFREEYGGVFVDLGVVDQQGLQITYAGPYNLKGADYRKAEWFKDAIKSDYFISDVFAGLRGTPHFIIAVGKSVGAQRYTIKATINFETFNNLVANLRVGETGFAFIINRQGEFQTKPRHDVALYRGPYRDLLVGKLDPKQYPVIERPDVSGVDVFLAMAPLKRGEWILCLQQRASDAYAYFYDSITIALVIILIAGVIIVIVAFLVSRNLVGRLRDSEQERAIIKEKVIETGRMASLGELAAGIAHEINNPVAIMVEEAGWIEDILSEDKPMDEEGLSEIQRAVQMIRTQGDRCKDITYKLLSFARKTDPTVKLVGINDMVEDVVALLAQKSRFASVRIQTELARDLPEIAASPSELQQVLLNLLNNAVDAMDKEGGEVTVETELLDGQVIIEVADTGGGIPEANLGRIFDPFFTTKPVGRGTGLGLSICYGIIEKMGGDIGVKSAVGKGTTFTVKLPVADRHQAADGQAPAQI